MKFYISGPISKEKAYRAKTFLEGNGHSFVMMPDNRPNYLRWYNQMPQRIEMLKECEGIILLEGWDQVSESKVEKTFAEEMKLTILYMSVLDLEPIEVCKEIVSDVTKISYAIYTARGRNRENLYARVILAKLLSNFVTDIRIIANICNRHRTTIIHHSKVYENDFKVNKQFRDLATEAENLLLNYVSH